MANNYNKMYKQTNVETTVPSFDEPKVAEANATEAVKEEPKFKFGMVANCDRLNVRRTPSLKADIVTVLEANSVVKVFEDKSARDFYKISYETEEAVVKGFCMKQYIEL